MFKLCLIFNAVLLCALSFSNICKAQSRYELLQKMQERFILRQDSIQIIVYYSCDFEGSIAVYYKDIAGLWHAELSVEDVRKEFFPTGVYTNNTWQFYKVEPPKLDSVKRTTIYEHSILIPKHNWKKIEKRFRKLKIDSLEHKFRRSLGGRDGCSISITYRTNNKIKHFGYTNFDLQYWYNFNRLLLPKHRKLRLVRRILKIKTRNFKKTELTKKYSSFISQW